MTRRVVYVAPAQPTGRGALHLPRRPCTRSAAMTARCDHGSIAEAVRRGDTR
jgi:hypothetical protein